MFYTNFVDLCNQIGKSPSAVVEEMGMKRSVYTAWGDGRKPRQATLQKVASYFGVSVDYLLADKKENAPVHLNEDETDFIERSRNLDPEKLAMLRAFLNTLESMP